MVLKDTVVALNGWDVWSL